jgi:hypothetical protein
MEIRKIEKLVQKLHRTKNRETLLRSKLEVLKKFRKDGGLRGLALEIGISLARNSSREIAFQLKNFPEALDFLSETKRKSNTARKMFLNMSALPLEIPEDTKKKSGLMERHFGGKPEIKFFQSFLLLSSALLAGIATASPYKVLPFIAAAVQLIIFMMAIKEIRLSDAKKAYIKMKVKGEADYKWSRKTSRHLGKMRYISIRKAAWKLIMKEYGFPEVDVSGNKNEILSEILKNIEIKEELSLEKGT